MKTTYHEAIDSPIMLKVKKGKVRLRSHVCKAKGYFRNQPKNILCSKHGGKRFCKVEGREFYVVKNELCGLHGGWRTCKVEGCGKGINGQGL